MVCGVEYVYSFGGRPFKVDGDRMWDRRGRYIGRIVDRQVFGPSGVYLGEFKDETLGYRRAHASRWKGSHAPRMDRAATLRMDRVGRIIPAGWEDFHG